MTISWEPYLWEEPRPAPTEKIALLESQWGVTLPEEYKTLVSSCQGMTPCPSAFNVGRAETSLGVLLTLTEHEKWPAYAITHAYEASRHYVPARVFPFGLTPGGEFVCFDYRDAHSRPRVVLITVEGDLHYLADSFTDFLAMLHD